jgi:hypothetical protein
MVNWLEKLFSRKQTVPCRYCGGSEYKSFMVHQIGLGWFCNKEELESYLKLREFKSRT